MYDVGAQLGRFEVQRLLGEGAVAAVFLVGDEAGETWVLKVLGLRSSDQVARFEQEAELQRTLAHRNIVRVLEALEVDGRSAMRMADVPSVPLDQWLEQRASVDPVAADRIFGGILEGVAHAHRHGVVHRDLKPANVLISEPEGEALITDFGIAKVLGDTAGGLALTHDGMTLGTPSYMAPEQIGTASEVDHRADVFALGCILYELHCGERAFDGPTVEVYRALKAGTYRDPLERELDLRPGVVRAIRGALVADREARFDSCDALREAYNDDSPLLDVALGGAGLTRGMTVGRYVVEEFLGDGSIASVYRVRHLTLHTPYALKVVHSAEDAKLRAQLIQEGQQQALIQHHNVVGVHDVLEVDGAAALLMDFVDGPTLEAWLRDREPTDEEVSGLFLGILEGLEVAHGAGRVHGDLNPGNVLLSLREEQWVPKIADFGLTGAWLAGRSAEDHLAARTRYTAPELEQSEAVRGVAADVYALGRILEDLCGGAAPAHYEGVVAGCTAEVGERLADCAAVRAALGELPAPVPKKRPPASVPPVSKKAPVVAEPLAPTAAETPSSTGPSKQGLLLAAGIALPALALGAVALAVVGGAVMWSMGSAAEPVLTEGNCPGVAGEVVGYAWGGNSFRPEPDGTWVPRQATNVRREYPNEANNWDRKSEVVCQVNKGQRVRLDAEPVDARGSMWVPIVAGALE